MSLNMTEWEEKSTDDKKDFNSDIKLIQSIISKFNDYDYDNNNELIDLGFEYGLVDGDINGRVIQRKTSKKYRRKRDRTSDRYDDFIVNDDDCNDASDGNNKGGRKRSKISHHVRHNNRSIDYHNDSVSNDENNYDNSNDDDNDSDQNDSEDKENNNPRNHYKNPSIFINRGKLIHRDIHISHDTIMKTTPTMMMKDNFIFIDYNTDDEMDMMVHENNRNRQTRNRPRHYHQNQGSQQRTITGRNDDNNYSNHDNKNNNKNDNNNHDNNHGNISTNRKKSNGFNVNNSKTKNHKARFTVLYRQLSQPITLINPFTRYHERIRILQGNNQQLLSSSTTNTTIPYNNNYNNNNNNNNNNYAYNATSNTTSNANVMLNDSRQIKLSFANDSNYSWRRDNSVTNEEDNHDHYHHNHHHDSDSDHQYYNRIGSSSSTIGDYDRVDNNNYKANDIYGADDYDGVDRRKRGDGSSSSSRQRNNYDSYMKGRYEKNEDKVKEVVEEEDLYVMSTILHDDVYDGYYRSSRMVDQVLEILATICNSDSTIGNNDNSDDRLRRQSVDKCRMIVCDLINYDTIILKKVDDNDNGVMMMMNDDAEKFIDDLLDDEELIR